MSESTLRIGQGIDYHRLVEGRKLILGGVEIPFQMGLEGHSDADVLAHAICDALLGAAGIGRHRAALSGYRSGAPGPVQPRIPARGAGQRLKRPAGRSKTWMPPCSRSVPSWCRTAPAMKTEHRGSRSGLRRAVSIKATTTEGMNAEGRGEGISAQAIALLQNLT